MSGLMAFIVVGSYWSINFIAVELEQPFGDDDNDLPLKEMQEDMNNSLCALMKEQAQEVPAFTYHRDHDELSMINCDFDVELNPSCIPYDRCRRTSSYNS